MAKSWKWVAEETILAAHAEQLAEHGGLAGVRDIGLLRSALARPLNLLSYGDPDAAALAAAYAYGIARNHPFADGNKRAALVVAEGFLFLNSYELDATDAELVELIFSLAAGDVTEDALADWLRKRLIRVT
jgi:death on curing protein